MQTLVRLGTGLLLLAIGAQAQDRFVIGMTAKRTPIEAVAIPGPAGARELVLLGGLHGKDATSAVVEGMLQHFRGIPLGKRKYAITAIPVASPDGLELVFPPEGKAYAQNPEAQFLWRWLMVHAPDAVIEAGGKKSGLSAALGDRIPVLDALPEDPAISPNHREKERRLARTPREVAQELAKFYGHDFAQPVYIQAMALIGRLRMGERAEVEALAAPYLDGRKDSLVQPTTSHLAGHLLFAELAEVTHDTRYAARVRAAAELAATDLPVRDEMSDGVFMAGPILASAGKLDVAAQQIGKLQHLCRRPDGLYRHSPLNEAAWGRGNAFPALGLAWTLSKMPPGHPAYAGLLHDFRAHIAALAEYQDRDGMWHEVIDEPGSYAEFSATAMLATAMLRGIRRGWLERTYEASVQRAWQGLLMRIAPEGVLIDVCESTGKQKTLDAYLNRAASDGKDARGGGMALLLATEMMEQ